MEKVSELMEEIKKNQGNLHQIIEYLAIKEQKTDLKEFLRRESVIPNPSA